MSRNPINEEIYHLGSQLRKGMDSLTIADPGRLKVPFGNSGKPPKKQSWMTVNAPASECEARPVHALQCLHTGHPLSDMHDVVMDMPKRQAPAVNSAEPRPESYWEVPGWMLALGYSIFGLGLALCNLLSPQHAGRVCSVLSPIPLLCLILQALTCVDLGHIPGHNKQGGLWILGPIGLVLSACTLPSACVCWTLHLAVPLVLVLAVSVFHCNLHRDVLAWVCFAGVCLALLLALPGPVTVLEPRWGMTVAMFFAGVLCFLAGLGSGGVGFQTKLLN